MAVPIFTRTEYYQEVVRLNQPAGDAIESPIRGAGILSTICSIAYGLLNNPLFISAILGLSTFAIGLIARKIITRYAISMNVDRIAVAIERRLPWLLPAILSSSLAIGLAFPIVSHLTWATCGLYAGISRKVRQVVRLTP